MRHSSKMNNMLKYSRRIISSVESTWWRVHIRYFAKCDCTRNEYTKFYSRLKRRQRYL